MISKLSTPEDDSGALRGARLGRLEGRRTGVVSMIIADSIVFCSCLIFPGHDASHRIVSVRGEI